LRDLFCVNDWRAWGYFIDNQRVIPALFITQRGSAYPTNNVNSIEIQRALFLHRDVRRSHRDSQRNLAYPTSGSNLIEMQRATFFYTEMSRKIILIQRITSIQSKYSEHLASLNCSKKIKKA